MEPTMTPETSSRGSDCPATSAQRESVVPTPEDAARRSQRRRLWQLPTQAHEFLLAISFTPDWLRREAARTLGQMHKGQCVLRGRDVDVFYSLVRDLVTRNPLSEAMHKHLDARHAQALRTLAAAKDEPALRASWARALADDTLPAVVPASLWAVLTHPLGQAIESAVLYDARAWVFAHARHSVGLAVAQRKTEAVAQQARQRADELQARLSALQQQSAEVLRRTQIELACLQGELARRSVAASASRASPAVEQPAKKGANLVSARARSKAQDRIPAVCAVPDRTPAPIASPKPVQTAAQAPPQIAAVSVAGRRVLCVGGIQHAVARYRGRIEKLGGRFEHHDGGLEESVQTLDARLGRADVVICQAACINHEAYHRVKRHCERTGTPCVYLESPSLSRLDRALTAGPGERHTPG